MSKYEKLWQYVKNDGRAQFTLSFDEIAQICGAFDHSFLNSKKELGKFGYTVGKISLKNKTVIFEKQ